MTVVVDFCSWLVDSSGVEMAVVVEVVVVDKVVVVYVGLVYLSVFVVVVALYGGLVDCFVVVSTLVDSGLKVVAVTMFEHVTPKNYTNS